MTDRRFDTPQSAREIAPAVTNAYPKVLEPAPRGTALLRWAMYASAFTASWTAAAVGGFNVVDYALGAAFVVLCVVALAQRRFLRVRAWMWAALGGAALTSAWNTIVSDEPFDATMMLRIFLTTVCVGMLVLSSLEWIGAAFLFRLLRVWVGGVVVNSLAAIAVSTGTVSFSGFLTQATGERLSGLASHPNSLAFSITMALAPCVFLVLAGPFRFFWVFCFAMMAWAGVLSDSRSLLLVGIPVLLLSLIVAVRRSHLRSWAIPILIVGGIATWWTLPNVIGSSRLAGDEGALSDAGRTVINENAMRIFLDNPLTGSSFANQAGVSVILTVLSAGGLIFAAGYYLFIFGPVHTLWRARSVTASPYGLLCIVALLGFGLLNPVFMERATYWPIVIAFAICRHSIESRAADRPVQQT